LLKHLKEVDPEIYKSLSLEFKRQQEHLEMIASENYASYAVMEAQGSVLTNKYAEGLPHRRYYGGCEYVDIAEDLAIKRVKEIFGGEHANVQPHSGSQANQAVFFSQLKPGDTIMGMSLAHGGHLTHGAKVNLSGIIFNAVQYGVNPETELIDYDEVYRLAKEHKPKMIVAGASAYSRVIDWAKFREIADSIDALLMVDMAHYAGLIAGGAYPSPIPYADFTTSTTHKTLRGPRGGFILSKQQYGKDIDKWVFPRLQGGPLMHVIAAKAVAFKEAMTPEFREYAHQTIKNARVLVEELKAEGLRIVSEGTDSHIILVDLRPLGVKGNQAEEALGKANITVNKNAIPFDPEKPMITSGIRLGTAALTTRGMKEKDMRKIAKNIVKVLKNLDNEKIIQDVKEDVLSLCSAYPLYPEWTKDYLG